MKHEQPKYERPVYIDTTLLWSVDPLVDNRLTDRRATECFAYLCDAACDARRKLYCVAPSEARLFDKEAPLPKFYRALEQSGLLAGYKIVNPTEDKLRPGDDRIMLQLSRFALQCELQADVNREFGALHRNRVVVEGWKKPGYVPGVDTSGTVSRKKFKGVPDHIEQILLSQGKPILDTICRRTHWSQEEAVGTFAIVSRGWSYWQGAVEQEAEYLTQPARWQVLLGYEQKHERPTAGFGPAVGGILLDSINANEIRPDANEICDKLAHIRQNAEKLLANHGTTVFAPTNEKDSENLVGELLAGVVGRPLKKPYSAGVRLLLKVLAVVTAERTEKLSPPWNVFGKGFLIIDDFLASRVTRLPAPLTKLSLVRRILDYSFELDMTTKTCSFCGSVLLEHTCRLQGCPSFGKPVR